MAKQALRSHGPRPTANERKQVQGTFPSSPLVLDGSSLIEGISEEGDKARDEVEPENNKRQRACSNLDDKKNHKATGKRWGNVSSI